MKLHIAICDDCPNHLNIIVKYLEDFNRNNRDYDIYLIKACSGEELLEKIKKESIDIVFLDIEMEGLNGIQVGNELRVKLPKAVIVFITGFKDYALEAFEIQAFQYMIKPITPQKFHALMKKILTRFKERLAYEEKNNIFFIRTKQQTLKIRYDEIYYFERQGKKILVETDKGSFQFLDTLQKIIIGLKSKSFIRCHHGFIANVDKIFAIENDFILFREINQKIPVSRRYKEEVLDALSKNLFED
ncbi:two component transcriptional regulator, LytTR family [Anaerovirgula multivorans]|uniref:Stage 0 sporulation protein A homolog n=1 Tax=Anaerovirgula multivorans TaxID=312168 RepID=A0A239KZ98_9FIRM|nr:LytTR family DNA-binding domain-containing protein [Anaerovirgula multivorans]SNT22809.1 two component transcriptional regulator, LytTR family [Anaerovirgula multivorans]